MPHGVVSPPPERTLTCLMIRSARYACCLLALTATLTGWAQPAPEPSASIVATFAGETITLRDFEIAYAHDVGGWDEARSHSTVAYDQFLSTYVDYRLKVHAAQAAGYAEKPSLQGQHRRYRLQLIRHRLRTDSLRHPAMHQKEESILQMPAAEDMFWRRARNRYAVQIDTLKLLRQLGTRTLNGSSQQLRPFVDAQPASDANENSALTVEELAAFWDARPGIHNQPLNDVLEAFLQETVLDRAAQSRMAWDRGFRRAVQRHRDGLLMFELMQDSVWTPALTDTSAQHAYFLTHRDQYTRATTPTQSARTSASKAGVPVRQVAHSSSAEATFAPVSFGDVRRIVVRDFQAYRERQFVEDLRNRYRAQRYSHPLQEAFQERPSPTAHSTH